MVQVDIQNVKYPERMRLRLKFNDVMIESVGEFEVTHHYDPACMEHVYIVRVRHDFPRPVEPVPDKVPNTLASQRCMNTIDYMRSVYAAEDEANRVAPTGLGKTDGPDFAGMVQKLMARPMPPMQYQQQLLVHPVIYRQIIEGIS